MLDGYFSSKYKILPVSMDMQRLGIDRIFEDRTTGMRWAVEYKTDDAAETTNNVFVETVSVDTQNKLGWALTSCAQILVYYIPPRHMAYTFSLAELRARLALWKRAYGTKSAKNQGYATHGIPVPIRDIGPVTIGKPAFIKPPDSEKE